MIRSVVALSSFLVLNAALDASAESKMQDLGYVDGEYIIGFSENIDADEFSARVNALSGGDSAVIDLFPRINAAAVRISSDGVSAASLMSLVSSSPDVRFIEPNYLYAAIPAAVPNDSEWDELWYFADDKIGIPDGWPFEAGDKPVVVAVIDSGIFYEHKDLSANIWRNSGEVPNNNVDDDDNGYVDDIVGWDFFNGDNDPTADLVPEMILGLFEHPTKKVYEDHGTHVACTIACAVNNSEGVSGVAPAAQIMSLKFLGGAAGSGSLADAIRAIIYAVDNGADVINNSWGGGPYSEALRDSLLDAQRAGVVVVAAAGNGGPDQIGDDNDVSPHYPSSYDLPALISVAATDLSDQLTEFSNFGRFSVDIGAPGSRIFSAIPVGDENSIAPSHEYGPLDGTSMATPIVSGVIANIISKFPSLTHLEVIDRLYSTSDNLPHLQDKVGQSARVNFKLALAEPTLPEHLVTEIEGLSEDEKRIVLDNFGALSPSNKVRILRRTVRASQATDDTETSNRIKMDPAGSYIVIWNDELSEEQKKRILEQFGAVTSIEPISPRRRIDEILLAPSQGLEGLNEIQRQIPEIRSFEQNQTIRLE